MNITSNVTHDKLMNTRSCIELQEYFHFRFVFAHLSIICFSVGFYGMLFFLSRYIKLHSKLSKVINFIKSVLSGLIFSLFLDNQRAKKVSSESFSNFEMLILNNLSYFLIGGAYFLFSLGILVYRAKTYEKNRSINLSNDCETSLSNKVDNKKKYTSNHYFDKLKKFVLDISEEYNTYFYPFIYLSALFFHSFFSGLGFSGQQYFGLSGIIILIHKIYELYSIQQIAKILRLNSTKSLYLMLFFNLLTPIGIIIRGYLTFNNVLIDTNIATKLCHRIFAQSFFIMACIEALMPISQTLSEVLLNVPVTFCSYMYFNLYLKNNEIVF